MSEKAPSPLPSLKAVKLVICDVDGTLLTDDHEIHARTRDAIAYIRKTHPHVQIAVATGKQRNSCEWFIQELDMDDFPAASCHGCILHGPKGKIIKTIGIGNANAVKVAEECQRKDLTCFLFTAEGVHLVHGETVSGTDWIDIASKYDKNVTDEVNTGFLDRVRSGEVTIVKATICLSMKLVAGTMTHFTSILPSEVRVARALPFIIEIVPAGVDKSVALRHFCSLLKCGPENVVAFGDGENDVELLAAAGHGVAMGNAMQAAVDAAKHQTLSNNEGGVGVFLDRIFRPKDAIKSAL